MPQAGILQDQSSIVKIMRNAFKVNWTTVDDFEFIFYNRNRPFTINTSTMNDKDLFDVAIINIDLPQMGSSIESVMQAGEWRVYNAKFEPFSFTITFRDFASLDLRNYFSQVWMDAQRGYFDDVKSTVEIRVKGKTVFKSDDCLISAVSQVQLTNNENQIAEFSVEFTSPYFSNDDVTKFGSDTFTNKNKPTISVGKLFGETTLPTGSILGGLSNTINKITNWF